MAAIGRHWELRGVVSLLVGFSRVDGWIVVVAGVSRGLSRLRWWRIWPMLVVEIRGSHNARSLAFRGASSRMAYVILSNVGRSDAGKEGAK